MGRPAPAEAGRECCSKCAAEWVERAASGGRRSYPPNPGCGPNPPSRYQRELFRRIDAGERVSLGRGIPF